MVGTSSPHAYAEGLLSRGGSADLLREIRQVDFLCSASEVVPIYTLMHLAVKAKVSYVATRDAIFCHKSHYKLRHIAKRSGNGFRTIHEPSTVLRALQQIILRECLPTRASSPLAFAYETNRNTASAAKLHVGARAVIHIDLVDFYGSVKLMYIVEIFKRLGYPKLLSFEMALICTVGNEVKLRNSDSDGLIYSLSKRGYLPQGASTSGKLANMVCAKFDSELDVFARSRGLVVTRYADDITFSAGRPLSREYAERTHREISELVVSNGFSLNRKKTRILCNVRQFRMLGLCVGESDVFLNKRYRSMVLAHLYGVEKFGLSDHASSRGFGSDLEFLEFIWGHYAYSRSIQPEFAREVQARLSLIGLDRF